MSDLKLPPSAAAAYYGHDAGVLRGGLSRRGGGDEEGDEEGEEDESAPMTSSSYASSGRRAPHHHHHHHDDSDDEDGVNSAEPSTRWNPKAGGETHHLRVKYEIKERRGTLSGVRTLEAVPAEDVTTRLRTLHAVEAFSPHTYTKLDEHVPRSESRQPKNFDFTSVAILGLELLSAQTNTLQSIGVTFPTIAWANTGRHHQSASSYAFTLTGDPNGRGQGQVVTQSQTIVDNSELHDSSVYQEFGDINIHDLHSRQLKATANRENMTYDVLANSDLYRVILSKHANFAEHGTPYDIVSEYRAQQKQAIDRNKAPSEFVRNVPDYIVLPIVELMKAARPHVRTIDVSKDLNINVVAIDADSIESLQGTRFARIAERTRDGETEDARIKEILEETTVIAFELCFHYMLRNPDRTARTRTQRSTARPAKRQLTEEELRQLLDGYAQRSEARPPARPLTDEEEQRQLLAWRAQRRESYPTTRQLTEDEERRQFLAEQQRRDGRPTTRQLTEEEEHRQLLAEQRRDAYPVKRQLTEEEQRQLLIARVR